MFVTDACLTADPGVASSIPARSHTFLEIDHEIISTVILLPSSFSSLPLNHSRRVVVSYKRKYVHEVLMNCLFKLAQEYVVRWTDRPAMTIAVNLGRKATKQTNKQTNYTLIELLIIKEKQCVHIAFHKLLLGRCFFNLKCTYRCLDLPFTTPGMRQIENNNTIDERR